MTPENPSYPAAFAPRRSEFHWTPGEITWAEILSWMEKPRTRKDVDGYILATLKKRSKVHTGKDSPCDGGYHRDSMSVEKRSAIIALDADAAQEALETALEVLLGGVAYVLHTTYSSTPSEPRYRILVQVDREMAPDEYRDAAESLAQKLGGACEIDPSSFQAVRFMYKPSARKPEWFSYWVGEGEPYSVDELLDTLEIAEGTRAIPAPSRSKRDPFAIEGPVGAFNRVYDDWDELIEKFDLPYRPESDGRWHLEGAKSAGGLTVFAPGLVQSFHSHDPAYGTQNAFDLVRLHWFGDLDVSAKAGTPINRLPSYDAMMKFATEDERVKDEIFRAMTAGIEHDFSAVEDDEDLIGDEGDPDGPTRVSWRASLVTDRRGKFVDDVRNWDLIRANDPVFALFQFNDLTLSPEATDDLPWRGVDKFSRDIDAVDVANLRFYLEREYGFRPSKEFASDLIATSAANHRVNPVREYLESLEWDGVPRLETCLPGADDTAHNRLVARKVLVGAVARMFEPGCKWDHTLVLHGPQGIGKTTWIERMAHVGVDERRPFHYSLGPIQQKDTLMAMHRSWIVVSDEGHSLRRSDARQLKEFLTQTHDVFRVPYDVSSPQRPRRFVIWSTTNDDVFLQRQEGNRRYLMVRCLRKFDIDAMTPGYVDQVWAEAVHLYRAGERLYLLDSEFQVTEEARRPFLEEDSVAGAVQEFLDQLVPLDWWTKSPDQRIQWLADRASGFEPEGEHRVDETCTRQVWFEALKGRFEPRRGDLLDIAASLKDLGWVSVGVKRFPGYGPQVCFVRGDSLL